MPSITPDLPNGSRPDLLARVARRGEQIRMRRRVAVGSALVTLVVMSIGLPLALAGGASGPGHRLTVVAGPPTDSTSTPVSTVPPPTLPLPTLPPETTPPSPTSTTAPSPTTSTTRPAVAPTTAPHHTTTTTAAVCTYGDQSGCGPNAPMTVTVVVDPVDPHPGQLVTFTETATDPDAIIVPTTCDTQDNYGDAPWAGCSYSCLAPDPSTAYQPTPGHLQLTFTHVYATAGTYKASFHLVSGEGCSGTPYASGGTAEVTVTVT